jgi:hypothetical protein
LSPDDAAENSDALVIAPEKGARSPNGLYEFREERWIELYKKKIEQMIGVLKSKGVPVLWVRSIEISRHGDIGESSSSGVMAARLRMLLDNIAERYQQPDLNLTTLALEQATKRRLKGSLPERFGNGPKEM